MGAWKEDSVEVGEGLLQELEEDVWGVVILSPLGGSPLFGLLVVYPVGEITVKEIEFWSLVCFEPLEIIEAKDGFLLGFFLS